MIKKINIIIIGCSSGLGKHLAYTFANYQNTYNINNPKGVEIEYLYLLLVSRRKELLEELKEFKRSDRKIEFFVQDIDDDTAPENIFSI